MMMGMGMLMSYQDPNRENSTIFSVSVNVFLCPSDSAAAPNPSIGYVGNNYYTNSGGWLSDACEQFPPMGVTNGLPQGPMYNRSAIRYAAVIDGLSNTAVASEKLRGMGTYDVVRDLFWVPEVTSIDAMYQSCNTLSPGNGMGGVIASQMGGTWAVGDMTFTVYNHVGPPGGTSCSGMGGMMMPGQMAMVNESFQSPPTSNHNGGVNLLLGDGSVRFTKNSVALNVWHDRNAQRR